MFQSTHSSRMLGAPCLQPLSALTWWPPSAENHTARWDLQDWSHAAHSRYEAIESAAAVAARATMEAMVGRRIGEVIYDGALQDDEHECR